MSLTVEIPVRRAPAAVPEANRCAHQRANGRRCPRAAVEGGNLCERHAEWYRLVPPILAMPYPDDAVSLQETMARAVALVLAKILDAPRAHAVASLCRIMLLNLDQCVKELEVPDWDQAHPLLGRAAQ